MKDMNGVTLKPNARVRTKKGSEAYVISLHRDSGRVRIKLGGCIIRKVAADSLERY